MPSNLVFPLMANLTLANQNTFQPIWIMFFNNLLSYINSLPTGNAGPWPGFAVPNFQLSNTAANGTQNAAVSANATIQVFNDSNAPAGVVFGGSSNAGAVHWAARQDHVHSVPATNSIPLDTLGNPSNITTLNANTSTHGLCPQLSGNTSTFLCGNGGWTTPPSGNGVVGEGHFTILPWNFSSITQGSWAFNQLTNQWSGYSFRNTTAAQNDQINFQLCLASGTYTIRLLAVTGPSYAITTLLIDSNSVGVIDWYASGTNLNTVQSLSNYVATQGLHSFGIKLATRNANNTSGWYCDLSAVSFFRTA